jgi:hypothetical protein
MGSPISTVTLLPTYQVLICLRCRYAIRPGAVARHLKEIHYLHRSARQAFVDYAPEFELTQLNDVVLPHEDQFQCLYCRSKMESPAALRAALILCHHQAYEQHWRLVHHISASDESSFWKPVPLQTFFRGNALRYFTNPAWAGFITSVSV